jgi:hypothetical protein
MKKFLTLIDGKKSLFYFKDILKVFKFSYTEDILIRQDCLTLMAGFDIEGELTIDGCLEVF